MITEQKIDEILEAMWCAEEKNEFTLPQIRQLSSEEINEEDIGALEKEGLVLGKGERVIFTARGKERARTVVRRHRLTESLLTYVLQLPEEQVRQIACDMEHILPPEMEASICTLLGHPEISPSGLPIPPGADCIRKERSVQPVIVNLRDLKAGEKAKIAYIKPKNHARLHRLTSFGIVPGVIVELHQKYPAYCLQYEGTEVALEEEIAEDIFVRKLNNASCQ